MNITMDQYARLTGFSDAATRAADDIVLMRLADKAFSREFGHRLFTLLKVDRPNGLMRRIYSSNLEINPVGGVKPIVDNMWGKQVLDEGRHYIGRNRTDLISVFPDHEALFGIGCESVLNTPVLWRGMVIGSINILHAEEHYNNDMCALASVYGQYLAPVFLED